ncbi:hypothetical protein LOTGIDRAFT_239741 [Lottia gigantea]|uniref:Fibronectin type III-like domain-containing protein n=1 Tax=Lottia gigantea TaxID=225164 RepID=V4CBH1_LOTGI|nr:hypothetical protein LOTGIDRAFT_239741 [Lottia gigantea]ESO99214.1 hypothetical protein LOTGIDRAFT_239741 [Lottia gigantea]
MAVTALAFCLLFLVNSSLQDFPFRNTSLLWDERVDDLVGRLTLDEIQLQMAKGGAGINGPAPAIDRLGIKPYQWDTECLHGDVGHNATAYPQSIGLAATFSTDLIFRMAEATAVEVRATNHANVQNGSYKGHTGLSCFAPVINIMRDPRWGRNQETYGEDPVLNGMLSQAYIKGLQGDHPRYVRASGGCKHFNVHGGPDDVPVSRFSFDSQVQVSIRDWRTTFLPAFRYCVEADDAVSQGKLTEDLVRERVKPLFYTRMRLGEFDPPEMNPYASINRQFITTPRQGLSSLASSTNFAQGCDDAKCKSYDSNSVKSAVDGVDVVFICLGLGTILEAEGNDRHDMELPSGQVQLMADAVANSGSAKVVLISFNAGPVNITWADVNPRVSAIIAAFYPGQATGVALKNVMVGDSYSQFGRLPYTWYYTADQVPPITNYTMVDRTYRYMSSQPLYPFGYGLTYSTFNYDELITVTNVNAGDDNNIGVHFNNKGSRTADEVVQVYIGWKSPSVPTPKIQLVNFTRVTVPQGSGLNLNFTITPQNMAVYTDDKGWVVEEGTLILSVGGQQPSVLRTGTTNYISTEFNIVGTKILGFY